MGAKHSSNVTSGAHHVRQEINRQPRRREESTYARSSVLQSSSRTRSSASNMGSVSYTETDKTLSQWDGSDASSTGNCSGIGTCESFASSRSSNFGFRSEQASTITERLSTCGRQSVYSRLGSSNREDRSFSPRAHQANGHYQRLRLLQAANISGSGVSGAMNVQVNTQPVRMDHYNMMSLSLMQQLQWPGYCYPPSAAVFKISCAGRFTAPSLPAGFGAVIRTQEGSFLAAFSGKLASCEHEIIAEIFAIKEGLRLAAWMNLQSVEIKSSSLFLINELQNPGDNWLAYPYNQLLNEIKGMAANFKNCKLLHVKQEANSVALWLAMYGFFLETSHYFWFYGAPSFILPALQQDVHLGYI